jgi:SAM-dependent methyltransferase
VLKIPPAVTAVDLDLLKQQREEADRRYQEALAAVDRSILTLPDLPHPPPRPDEHQVTPLNQRWDILRGDPTAHLGGWRRRIARFIWRVVGPALDRQLEFNSVLVDHINRNVLAQRAIPVSVESTIVTLGEQLASLQAFQSGLVVYLQRITGYIDTKDRHEDIAAAAVSFSAALDGVADEVRKLSVSLASLQQLSLLNKRERDRAADGQGSAGPASPSEAGTGEAKGYVPDADAYKYVGFEQYYRGAPEVIRASQADYVPFFEGSTDVLDVGCGRGEFLDLLRERGIRASGLDGNHEMVELCRARGLDVRQGDALHHLSSLPDASLGGLFAAQVVEHFPPEYLVRVLETAYHKLRPGSHLVLETINPSCWLAFFSSYLRDPTHVRPVHPDTLEYLLLASGFQGVHITYRSPVRDDQRLQPVEGATEGTIFPAWAGVLNLNADKLNRLLFGFMDYAAIGERQ